MRLALTVSRIFFAIFVLPPFYLNDLNLNKQYKIIENE